MPKANIFFQTLEFYSIAPPPLIISDHSLTFAIVIAVIQYVIQVFILWIWNWTYLLCTWSELISKTTFFKLLNFHGHTLINYLFARSYPVHKNTDLRDNNLVKCAPTPPQVLAEMDGSLYIFTNIVSLHNCSKKIIWQIYVCHVLCCEMKANNTKMAYYKQSYYMELVFF